MNLTTDKKRNIFENMNWTEYFAMKKWIIKGVLTTDMAKHDEDLTLLKLINLDDKFKKK